MENSKSKKNLFRKIVTATICLLIAGCVAYVMFALYSPSQNSLAALSSVCMDMICMIILFILIGSFSFGNYGSNRTTRLFALLLLATIWAMFLDFLNWAFDGSLKLFGLTYWFTVGSLCMGSILACLFSAYLYSYMDGMHGLHNMRLGARVCITLNLLSFVLTFILAITGTAFYFADGHYETGFLYDVVTAIPVLTLLYLTVYIVCHCKKVGLHDVLAVVGYILFMVAGALIEAAYRIGTTYVSVAIADIFIFVMLQNEIIAREKRNVEKWIMKSNTDELTGFHNRSAYEADMLALEMSNIADNFVYVSIDVNSLKAVNDTIGHVAGDELLIGAAECIKKAFGSYGKLYRTGGDEFAALIYADNIQLDVIKKDIEEITVNWSGNLANNLTISCGYVSKREEETLSIRQMAVLADKRMYDAKEKYYQSVGVQRRS